MKLSKFFNNPYAAYLIFLVIYCSYILINHSDEFVGDEGMYYRYAVNLLNGFYSPPKPDFYIGFGPGYPLLLMPFIWLKLPLVAITLLNGIFQYLSIVFLYKALIFHTSKKTALFMGYFWACYYNIFEYLDIAVPEAFPTFLLVILLYKIVQLINSEFKYISHIFVAGFVFGILILTKVIFGYVLVLGTVGLIVVIIFSKNRKKLLRLFLVVFITMIVITPYLRYTYKTTGKFLYFGTVGGNNLYWMSSPFPKEYGSWFPFHKVDIDSVQLCINKPREVDFKKNHKEVFTIIEGLSGVERDSVFKSEAIKNIKDNPIKFAQNCLSNIGRLLFNFPYSYSYQKPRTLLRLPLSGTVVLFSLFCLIPTFLNWRRIPIDVKVVLAIATLYFGGSMLGSAETRMFTVIVPFLIFWIGYITQNTVRIKLKF